MKWLDRLLIALHLKKTESLKKIDFESSLHFPPHPVIPRNTAVFNKPPTRKVFITQPTRREEASVVPDTTLQDMANAALIYSMLSSHGSTNSIVEPSYDSSNNAGSFSGAGSSGSWESPSSNYESSSSSSDYGSCSSDSGSFSSSD